MGPVGRASGDEYSRKPYSTNFDEGGGLVGEAGAGGKRGKIGYEVDRRRRDMRQANDSDAPHFEQPGNGFGDGCDKPAGVRRQYHAVVGDQCCVARSAEEERQGERRLAATGFAADQDAVAANTDRGGVDRCGLVMCVSQKAIYYSISLRATVESAFSR